jgi:hypothetical protein
MSINTSDVITPAHRENNRTQPSVEIPEGLTPFVRYAETDENGNPDQFHRLHALNEPAPVDADFVSPVYLLTDEQVKKHDDLLTECNRFCVWDYKSIATKIQTECEDGGRVRYPLLVESDTEVDHYEMRVGLKQFTREVLDVDPNEGKWFFTGGTSLHVHLPYYVENEDALTRLRRETKQYNENAKVTVDASNFQKKSLVRLPGAEHYDTGVRKTAISPTSSDEELQKRIAQLVGGVDPEEREEISYYAVTPEIVRYSLSEELGHMKEIPTPIIEQQNKPVGTGNVERWKQYNRHPFCPYANAGNQRRSVVVAQVKGTPFCRKTTVNGIEAGRTYVPTFIYGAVGCDGEYTVWQENAPIQLSPQDYDKWEYEPGDTIVLLGGQSASSRILELEDTFEGKDIASQLLPDMNWTDDSTDGRKEALDLLRAFGYEVGSAGKNGPRRETSTNDRGFQSTDAYRLQERAEQRGVETLSHDGRRDLGNRLLCTRGWDGADEWFQEQYGERYDREITHRHLRSIASEFDDVPSPP